MTSDNSIASFVPFDVGYCSNRDLERDPGLLKNAKALLSVGHDEYWSRAMYENVSSARDDGLSVAFFSGNSVYHEIEWYEDTLSGAPCRSFARKARFADEDRVGLFVVPAIGIPGPFAVVVQHEESRFDPLPGCFPDLAA